MPSSSFGVSTEGHRGEQTPRTLILGDRRIAVAELLDTWLAPDYREHSVSSGFAAAADRSLAEKCPLK